MLVSCTTSALNAQGDANMLVYPGGDFGVTGVSAKTMSSVVGNVNRAFTQGGYLVANQSNVNCYAPLSGCNVFPPVGVLGPSAFYLLECTPSSSTTSLTARANFSGTYEVMTCSPALNTMVAAADKDLAELAVNADNAEVNSENPRHVKRIRRVLRGIERRLASMGMLASRRSKRRN